MLEIPRRKLLGMTMAVFGFFTTQSHKAVRHFLSAGNRFHSVESSHPARSLTLRIHPIVFCCKECGRCANRMCERFPFHHPPQPGKQFFNVSVMVVPHEQHVHIFKLVASFVPFQLRVLRPRKDEAVEDHGRVLQPLLDILDPFVKQNLL